MWILQAMTKMWSDVVVIAEFRFLSLNFHGFQERVFKNVAVVFLLTKNK